MTSSTSQLSYVRLFIFTNLIVLGLLVVFFTYYKSDVMFPGFSLCTESETNCFCDVETDRNKTHPESTTIVLIWSWPFGVKNRIGCRVFGITGCQVTADRSLYPKAHGVLFHHRDLSALPKEPRPSFQKWVWWNMESPENSAPHPEYNHAFNLTCSYRFDSDIPVPYGYLLPVMPEDEVFRVPAKDKLVCWIVSNWNSQFERVQYYNELKKHVTVNIYGPQFGQRVSDEDYNLIISSCKFYLSFENSVYKDYITEKLFNPLRLGSVPVVLGPSRQNYEDYIPGDAFIHVNDFASPKELALRLLHLDQHPEEYMNYLNWRSTFKAQSTWFGPEHACRVCSYLQTHRGYHVFHDLNKWYWG